MLLRRCASLPLSADAALSGSVSGLQGPAGPDAALPHCADRRGDVLLRDAPLSPRQAGHQGRERLGRDASGMLRLAPSHLCCFSSSLGGAAGLTGSVASFSVYLKELEAAESRLRESGGSVADVCLSSTFLTCRCALCSSPVQTHPCHASAPSIPDTFHPSSHPSCVCDLTYSCDEDTRIKVSHSSASHLCPPVH